jgi:hypothetical protein
MFILLIFHNGDAGDALITSLEGSYETGQAKTGVIANPAMKVWPGLPPPFRKKSRMRGEPLLIFAATL